MGQWDSVAEGVAPTEQTMRSSRNTAERHHRGSSETDANRITWCQCTVIDHTAAESTVATQYATGSNHHFAGKRAVHQQGSIVDRGVNCVGPGAGKRPGPASDLADGAEALVLAAGADH